MGHMNVDRLYGHCNVVESRKLCFCLFATVLVIKIVVLHAGPLKQIYPYNSRGPEHSWPLPVVQSHRSCIYLCKGYHTVTKYSTEI